MAYKCAVCGKPYEKLPEVEGKFTACTCGSRIFMKARPQHVRRVRTI